MFNWVREFLEIKHEFRARRLSLLADHEADRNRCPTCRMLKDALERANYEKDQLLNKLFEKKSESITTLSNPNLIGAIPPKYVPWNIRQQMLEAEDRKKAELLKNAPKESTDDLEKELNLAESARQNTTGFTAG